MHYTPFNKGINNADINVLTKTYVDFYVEKKSNDSYEQKQISQYEKQLKSVQKKIDNIMMAVMQGIGIETAKDYLAPLEEDKKQLNKLIDQAKNSVKILDKERLFNIINSWLDISSLIAMSNSFDLESDRITRNLRNFGCEDFSFKADSVFLGKI